MESAARTSRSRWFTPPMLRAPALLPPPVLLGQAYRARPEACQQGGLVVREEHPPLHVPAAVDRTQRRRAVQEAVDLGAPVSSHGAWRAAGKRYAVWPDEGVHARSTPQGLPL